MIRNRIRATHLWNLRRPRTRTPAGPLTVSGKSGRQPAVVARTRTHPGPRRMCSSNRRATRAATSRGPREISGAGTARRPLAPLRPFGSSKFRLTCRRTPRARGRAHIPSSISALRLRCCCCCEAGEPHSHILRQLVLQREGADRRSTCAAPGTKTRRPEPSTPPQDDAGFEVVSTPTTSRSRCRRST